MKTSELTGAALDWAVTKCEGFDTDIEDGSIWGLWGWATDWSQGGPIIEREKVCIQRCIRACEYHGWLALKDESFNDRSGPDEVWGDTPLLAAMRCYVANKLGDEIEIPEELK
jgi:hypothetical protein